jgi:hypothetical protein
VSLRHQSDICGKFDASRKIFVAKLERVAKSGQEAAVAVMQDDHRWLGSSAIGNVDRIRKTTTKTTTETAYYLLRSVLPRERCDEDIRPH